jgi:hypothetical protein
MKDKLNSNIIYMSVDIILLKMTAIHSIWHIKKQ